MQGYKVCTLRELLLRDGRLTVLAVQHLLSRPYRQVKGAHVQDHQGARERRDRTAALQCWPPIRGYRVPYRQPRMGVLPQAVSRLGSGKARRHTETFHSGFRSSFDRGCLSLWFNFRRNVSPNPPSSIRLRAHHLASSSTASKGTLASDFLVRYARMMSCIHIIWMYNAR